MIKLALIVCLFTVQMSCTTIKVTTEHEPSVDFSKFNTYRWSPTSAQSQRSLTINHEFLDRRIRQAVERQLADKGYSEQQTETPDFLIRYRVWLETTISQDEHAQWAQWTHRIGSIDEARRPTYGSDSGNRVRQYKEGTLLLIFFDGKTNKIIWRGSAQTQVKRSDTREEQEQRINEAVKRMLAQFPPK